jgi:hypothetical protein
LPPVSTKPSANFATSFASVVDTSGKFAAGVVDTDGKFAAGVVDTDGKFAAGVVDTGGKICHQYTKGLGEPKHEKKVENLVTLSLLT